MEKADDFGKVNIETEIFFKSADSKKYRTLIPKRIEEIDYQTILLDFGDFGRAPLLKNNHKQECTTGTYFLDELDWIKEITPILKAQIEQQKDIIDIANKQIEKKRNLINKLK